MCSAFQGDDSVQDLLGLGPTYYAPIMAPAEGLSSTKGRTAVTCFQNGLCHWKAVQDPVTSEQTFGGML